MSPDTNVSSVPSEQQLIEQLISIASLEVLLTREKVIEVGKCAKVLYGAFPAHSLRQPAESSGREKLIRALTIQIAILEALSGSGYHDLEWIMLALLHIRMGLDELEKGFTPPLLRARKSPPGAGRETHYQQFVKDTSAIAWGALCRLGINKTKAAEMVAASITKRRFLPARHPNQKSASARSIINWSKRTTAASTFGAMMSIYFERSGPPTSSKQIITDFEQFLEANPETWGFA